MSFDKLSNDLIIEIFRHVDDYKTMWTFLSVLPKNLAAVSVCCRRFCDLAQPQLYSKFNQSGRGIWNVSAFFQAVVSKPDRARYLRHFRANFGDESVINTDLSFLTDEERNLVRQIWMPDSIVGVYHSEAWHKRLFSHCNWDAMIAVFIQAFSNNLESLDLNFADASDSSDVMELIRSLQYSEDSMPRLRSVSISQFPAPQNTKRVLGIKYLVPYLRFKSVIEFLGHDIQDLGWRSSDPSYIFNAVDLHLSRSNLSDDSLRNFLSCFHSLKSFTYSNYKLNGLLSSSAIREGLGHVKHCLELLCVSKAEDRDTWTTMLDNQAFPELSMGSLADFTQLKTLVIDSDVFLGSEQTDDDPEDPTFGYSPGRLNWYYTSEQVSALARALPRSLEILHLQTCSPAIFNCMAELFYNDYAPLNLKTVDLSFRKGFPIEPHDDGVTLWKDAALAKGITVRLLLGC